MPPGFALGSRLLEFFQEFVHCVADITPPLEKRGGGNARTLVFYSGLLYLVA